MKKASILISFVASSFASMAQDSIDSTGKAASPALEVAGVKITGSVDAYYRYNFNNPKSKFPNNYTSFTNSQNSFELGMASLQASHSFGKAGVFVDLGFGRRAEEFNYTDGDRNDGKNGFLTLAAVKQLNVSYAVSDKLKFTLGKWATHIGYELADAYLNRNYSMSYMFSYGPFTHTGLKADIGLGSKSAIMLGVANATDYASANRSDYSSSNSSRKFALAQFSTATSNDKFKAYLNYQGTYGGSFSLSQLDAVFNIAASSTFSIGVNGTVQSVKPKDEDANAWWGVAGYLNLDPTSKFGVTLRGEYFDNKKAVAAAPNTGIFDVTLSPNFKIGNLTVIPELRLDAANDDGVFEKNDGLSTKTTVTGILAVTYHF